MKGMITYYKTSSNAITVTQEPQPGSWISVVEPTQEEIEMLIGEFGLDTGFVKSSLDETDAYYRRHPLCRNPDGKYNPLLYTSYRNCNYRGLCVYNFLEG